MCRFIVSLLDVPSERQAIRISSFQSVEKGAYTLVHDWRLEYNSGSGWIGTAGLDELSGALTVCIIDERDLEVHRGMSIQDVDLGRSGTYSQCTLKLPTHCW